MIAPVEAKAPAYLKLSFFGNAGSGKTWTATQLMAQFVKEYTPKSRLIMFDTEGGSGFVADMVKAVTGKPLLVVPASSFSELADFLALVKQEGHVAIIDSITHPWRKLCEEALVAKQSRIEGAGGNPKSARMGPNDWQLVMGIWDKGFLDTFRTCPANICMIGRAGNVWETVTDEEGKQEVRVTGTKMKVQSETGYESNLMVEMVRIPNPAYDLGKSTTQWLHQAQIVKDRANKLTGLSASDPDIEFFRPHIEFLVGGSHVVPPENPLVTVESGHGKSYDTVTRERQIVLDEIKDDLVATFPGQSAAEKKNKVNLLRSAFGTSSWTALEGDWKTYTEARLVEGRSKLGTLLAEIAESKPAKETDSDA